MTVAVPVAGLVLTDNWVTSGLYFTEDETPKSSFARTSITIEVPGLVITASGCVAMAPAGANRVTDAVAGSELRTSVELSIWVFP